MANINIVTDSLNKLFIVCAEWATLTPPNNNIPGFDFEENKKFILSLKQKIEATNVNNLIGTLETICREIHIPTVGKDASYSEAMLKSNISDVIFALNDTIRSARACGYPDPYANFVNPNSGEIGIILSKIASELEVANNIQREIVEKSSKITGKGYEVTIGPIKSDAKTIKADIEKAITYISTRPYVNATALHATIKRAQESAIYIARETADKPRIFGKAFLEKTMKVSRLLTDAFIETLQVVKIAYQSLSTEVSETEIDEEAARAVIRVIFNEMIEKGAISRRDFSKKIPIYARINQMSRGKYYISLQASDFVDENNNLQDRYYADGKPVSMERYTVNYNITADQARPLAKIGSDRLSKICRDVYMERSKYLPTVRDQIHSHGNKP